MSCRVEKQTASEILEFAQEWLREYPEIGSGPIEVEHDEGVLDTLTVSAVEVVNGTLVLIVNGPEMSEPAPLPRAKRHSDSLLINPQTGLPWD